MIISGIKANPREIAEKILNNLQNTSIIVQTEVAGPGFINVWISKDFGQVTLRRIVSKGVLPPLTPKKLKVLVDFSSPNLAKEMHVGHLRLV